MITRKSYFNDHIPHRVNLLITFRDHYADPPQGRGESWDQPRDFFRCSKDVSMLMVRFFCDEMGLVLPEGKEHVFPVGSKKWCRRWAVRTWSIDRFQVSEAQSDRARYKDLLLVLKAANRAVAHMESSDVDHPFKVKKDHAPLFNSIYWLECLIDSHIYRPNKKSLAGAMALKNNRMKL